MAISAQRGAPFVFYIRIPTAVRVLLLAYVALGLFGAAFIPSTVSSEGFRNYPALWWLILLFVVLIALGLRGAFPPRSAQASLEVWRDRVTFIPRRITQRLHAESIIEAAITPQAQEIFLCRSFFEGIPDGYRVIIRAVEEPECEVSVKFFVRPDEQDCKQIADGITVTTGLPVRLVTRRRSADGTVEETPWIPVSGKATTGRTFVFMMIAAAPYLGGLIVGYLLPGPATIGIVGLALWFGQMLSIFIYARWSGAPAKYTKLSALTTIFTFGAAYGLAAVVGAFVLHAR